MSRRLIVNADDFGMTDGVSRGIAQAHRAGIVTSATAMVHLASFERSLAHIREMSALGLGLHITLTWGTPAAGADRVPSLVERDGRFPRDKTVVAGRGRPDELELECAAQLARFVKATGRPPTHVDSHHQVHTLSPVLEAVLDLASEHRLPVRSPNGAVRRLARARGLATPDVFLGEAGEEPYWTVARLLETIRSLPEGTTEIMCHPGHFDADLAHSRYGRQRETEAAALSDPKVQEAVRAAGVDLINYAALVRRGG
ncbi:MAG TPA: ChbG/HpnK family deacetylase [Candidatus Sulfotelmatobacter sp.]|nr:ChbG/HpnK family deacetylase [Candidatus Sulfotelmatobacter sp.]